MTEAEILAEICQQIKLLREDMAAAKNPTIKTAEAMQILSCDHKDLSFWHGQGLLKRYGAQKSGFSYLRSEVLSLQGMLLTGEVKRKSKTTQI